MAEWQKLGVRRAGAGGFPRGSDRAELLVPGSSGGPAFLMLKNHFVIKRYNNATAYALAIGHLADRLRGGGPFVQQWPEAANALNEVELREVQEHLTRTGHYSGTIDGAIGPESRDAIRAYQAERGMRADGDPGVDLLKVLRGG
jgi:membrane-bound lytic murein transglycosylase B